MEQKQHWDEASNRSNLPPDHLLEIQGKAITYSEGYLVTSPPLDNHQHHPNVCTNWNIKIFDCILIHEIIAVAASGKLHNILGPSNFEATSKLKVLLHCNLHVGIFTCIQTTSIHGYSLLLPSTG
jgi:hypothetical protein